MAEVFGPIGFAFGAIGFIFSTAGTVTEAWDNFHHYEEQMGLYQVRLGNLERKSNKWNILWKDVNFRGQSSAQMNGIKGRIHDLLVDIEQELRSHQLTDKGFWNTLRKGKRVKLKDISRGTMSIPRGLAHALWKNKKLERWMSRLQKEIEAIDTLSKDEFQERTAGFANKDPDETEVSRTMRLETFIQKLQSFAQKLHEQCTSTPTTKAWALGVRPPQRSKDSAEEIKGSARDINSWRDIAQVNIELVYTLEGEKIREGRLQLSHHRNHAQSPMLSPEIIKGEAAINDARIKRNILDEPRVRTRPIGKLIHDGFFQDIEINKAWQQDCARLIHGISNWNLFLWNTNWTQELCCYGLQIEQKVSAQDCFRQLFTAGLHEKPCVHHPWRLRNLGLVLAQLVLATPFRCTGDTGDAGDLELEEWNGEAWSSVYDVDILQRLLDRPNTEKIRDVIEFCMNDNSALAREPFKPGYILKCIDAIHDKITQWCDTELSDPSFYEELKKRTKNCQWPDNAYEQASHSDSNIDPADDSHSSHDFPQPGNSHPPADIRQPSRSLLETSGRLSEDILHDERMNNGDSEVDTPQQRLSLRPQPGTKKRSITEELELHDHKRAKRE